MGPNTQWLAASSTAAGELPALKPTWRASLASRASAMISGGVEKLRKEVPLLRETSLKTRQVFKAGPDDEQVEAPTSLGGVTHNGGGRYR